MPISAASVSRYLTNHGFTRAHGPYPGYTATAGYKDGTVSIRYHLGYPGADKTRKERQEAVKTRIERMRQALSDRYDVTLFEPEPSTTAYTAYSLTIIEKPAPQKFTAGLDTEREIRGTAHWVHITGKSALDRQASVKAGAAARKWAKELGKGRAYRVSSGYTSHGETFRYSVCYGFED